MHTNLRIRILLAVLIIVFGIMGNALAEAPEPLPASELTVVESLEAGRDLKVTVNLMPEVSYYSLNLYQDIGDTPTLVWHGYISNNSGSTQTIPGHMLEAGSYRLEVNASPYNFRLYQPATIERTITVTGARPTAPTLSLSDGKTPLIKQDVAISVDGVFQDFVATVTKNGVELHDSAYLANEQITYINGFDETGDYTFRVSVLRDGAWSAWSAPLEIHIGSLGMLDVPTFVSVPETVEAGADFSVEVAPVANAQYYSYSFVRNDYSSGRNTYAGRRVTMTDEDYPHLTPGVYKLTCTPCTDASYETQSVTTTIEVIEGSPAAGPSVELRRWFFRYDCHFRSIIQYFRLFPDLHRCP